MREWPNMEAHFEGKRIIPYDLQIIGVLHRDPWP